MHGAAVTLADQFKAKTWEPDQIIVTDMLDLTTFAALLRDQLRGTKLSLYMHENQLTYPLPLDPDKGPMRRQKGERDHHYVFVNFSSQLIADEIIFNSEYHRHGWFAALQPFLRQYPDFRLGDKIAALEAKSKVIPVGLNRDWLAGITEKPAAISPPLILWNQRWEYDKNPTAFFAALHQAKNDGLAFRLAICGESFSRQPEAFSEHLPLFADEIVHQGFADKETYRRLLWESDIVISTADHEFFGISILEAISAECFPILPKRLSYPELIPEPRHNQCLYESAEELDALLKRALTQDVYRKRLAAELANHVERYSWQNVIADYDQHFGA